MPTLFGFLENGPNLASAVATDIHIRGEWRAGYQVMLPSYEVFLTFAAMERDGEDYYEVAFPTLVEWPQ